MTNQVHCQLWMGSLEPYMTESFILTAFRKMGECPLSVKVMRNKFTGEPAGYCFVHFANDEEAIDAMHKLNSKPIPGTTPVVRFRLNNASNNANRQFVDREFSVWVGDLSPDVDDYNLYRVFSSKYTTIKTAKVILDNSGFSKGYGFVRFGSEDEMRDSLITMNGFIGLGTKSLKISNAVPKPKGDTPTGSTHEQTTNYNQYYDPSSYWQNYAANWQQQSYNMDHAHSGQMQHNYAPPPEQKKEDDLELIEHSIPLDVDKLNREKIEQDCNFWDALESSKWLGCEMLEVL
ncbi:tRNA selenocysteine 1-associated protein 1 [Euwallacea fornicatus]|uniref:tRNA selenocysteine 1-associated protein 1 n=1 Tax=Euwallacea fornicatus TaxID=995702 RepID=UPI00338D6C2D